MTAWRAVCLLALLGGDARSATPDFSGVWLPDARNSERNPRELPYTDAARAALQTYEQTHLPIDLRRDDAGVSCLHEPMPYMMTLLANFPAEFVLTPTQLTIIGELHGNVRRIHLDGRTPPSQLLPSALGFSLGHWEGETLVVQTTHMLTPGAGALSGYPPVGAARRIVERFTLGEDAQGRKRLANEITIHDPAVWTRPVVVRVNYRWSPGVAVGEYFCGQSVWDDVQRR